MSWFHHEESYDIHASGNITYGEPTITCGSGSSSGSSGSPSGSGAWGDYQNERTYCGYSGNQHTR